nr:peptide synthetase (AMP-binding enzyme) [Colletotrichum truncatum]KAF6784820.1 peptide synthetase (AMP-binding enzyme) [Colletotrichum truncatum]
MFNPQNLSGQKTFSEEQPGVLSPLYIVFTSGSTGKPKGVKISHGALSSAFHYQSQRLGFSSSQRVYDVASYAFDIAVSTALMTLASGGCLCVPSDRERKDMLTESFVAFNATLIHTTPSVFRMFDRKKLTSLQFLLNAGEPARKDDFAGWPTSTRLINTYGPAECTPSSTIDIHAGVGPGKLSTNIGFGTGVVTWVVDPQDANRLVPMGTVGELVLEGPLVGLGYLNQPQTTAAAFIENPSWLLQGSAGHSGRRGRLYKTGDLVRYEKDGSLVYIGRKDVQVKIRGQRVELGEVEHHVRQCLPEIDEIAATVISPGGDDAKLMLAVFMESDTTPTTAKIVRVDEAIEEALSTRVPPYMVPSVYFSMRKLPMNTSGKTDRKQLQQIGSSFTTSQIAELASEPQANKRMPSTKTERVLQEVWAQFLNLDADSIGVDDSFFRLGGDSITAMLVSSAIRQRLGDLSTADILARKTITSISQVIGELRDSKDQQLSNGAVRATSPFVPYFDMNKIPDSTWTQLGITTHNQVEDVYPCSSMQSHMLKAQTRDSRIYRMIHEFEISGSPGFDNARIAEAWQAVVQQHSLLRAKFFRHEQNETMTAMQMILKSPPINISFHDLGSLDSMPTREISTPPTYDTESLQHHLSVYRTSSDKSLVRLEINHAIMDGYSIDILYRDFRYALEQRLESTKASFRNFIEYAEGSQQESSREFWTKKLAEMEPCLFPTYEIRQSGQGTMYVKVPDLEGVQIHAFCARREMTLATLIQTAWAIVLHRLSGGQNMEPCFGTIMSSRDTPVDDITEIFGPVMCLVPTHVQLNKRSSILETMADVHEEYIGKLPHQTYPVMDLYEELNGDSQLLFNTALSIVRGDGAVEPVEACNGAILRFHEARDPVEVRLSDNLLPLQITMLTFLISTMSTSERWTRGTSLPSSLSCGKTAYPPAWAHVLLIFSDRFFLLLFLLPRKIYRAVAAKATLTDAEKNNNQILA